MKNPTIFSRCCTLLLVAPLLLCSLGAGAGPAKAKSPKPKLKKVAWTWESSTFQSQTAFINAQIAAQQAKSKALTTQMRQSQARITQATANFTVGKAGGNPPSAEEQAQGETAASPARPLAPQGGQPSAGVKQIDAVASALAKEQAALQDSQSLISQYQSAKQQLQDATQGSEENFQALGKGDLAKSGGFYAQRAVLDAEAKTEYVPGGPCGDYPGNWCSSPPDSVIHFGGKSFLNRECVAYAAWKRWSSGKPFATGDAGDWPSNSSKPTVGSVAIWNRGTVGRYGHVAYVTAVNADSITVSEFNWQPYAHSNRTIQIGGRGWPSRFWN